MRDIRVASAQFEHAPNDKLANFSKIESFVERAARQQVEIITFPECCITGYWHLRHLTRAELDDLAVADLDASLLDHSTGRRWIRTRRPELYGPLTIPTGNERDTRSVRFDKKGI